MGKKLGGSYVYFVLELRIKINIEINIKKRIRTSLRSTIPSASIKTEYYFSSLHLLAALNLSFVIRQETIVLIRMSQWNNTKSHIENGKNH